MTREELFKILDEIPKTVEQDLALKKVRDVLETEPLTDKERRI